MPCPARPEERHIPTCSEAECCLLPLIAAAAAAKGTDAGTDADADAGIGRFNLEVAGWKW